jgi:hypothetical protein
MAVPANAQQLQIKTPSLVNPSLKLIGVFACGAVYHSSVENMSLVGWNIQVLEKVMIHEPAIALIIEGTDWIVLIKVEARYTTNFKLFYLVHPDQFLVNENWG